MQTRVNIAVGLALAAVVAVAAWLVLGRGTEVYRVDLAMENAGQLVKGGRVEVAGVKIGDIERLRIDDRGQARITLKITDGRFAPFRTGTRATVRSVGQATTTNRFVDISPAPDNTEAIPNGGTLDPDLSRTAVDLDAVFSSIDGPVREDLRGLFKYGADIYAGSGAASFNRMLKGLDPTLASLDSLLRDVRNDDQALTSLVKTGATAAAAVASRPQQLETAVTATADTMRAVADESAALERALVAAPRTLAQAGATLRRTGTTASTLRPALRAVPASQPALQELLRTVPTTFRYTEPAAKKLRELLPSLDTSLTAIRQLRSPTVEMFTQVAAGLDEAMPMLEGVRFYGSDLILGIFNGLMSISSGQYNEQGRYLKIEFVQNPQTIISGALSEIIPGITDILGGLVPGVINVARNQVARCPGGNAPPAPDGSNPWYPKAGICDPTQSMSGLVNSPTAMCITMTTCVGDRRSLDPEPDKESTTSVGSTAKKETTR